MPTLNTELPVVTLVPNTGGMSGRLVADTVSDPIAVVYQFTDHKGKLQTLNFKWAKQALVDCVWRHGIPLDIKTKWQDSWQLTREQQVVRKAELEAQLGPNSHYLLKGDYLKPAAGATSPTPWVDVDTDLLVAEHAVYCKEIAERLVAILDAYQTDTPLERLELAMSFVGWIPYGVMAYADTTRDFGGIVTPVGCLVHRFADCDSKGYLLAGILAHLIEGLDLRWMMAPSHGYDAVAWATPESGMGVIADGTAKLVLADATTPLRFGEPTSHLKNSKVTGKFTVKAPMAPIPLRSSAATSAPYYHRRYSPLVQAFDDARGWGSTIRRVAFVDSWGWAVLAGREAATQMVSMLNASMAQPNSYFLRDCGHMYKSAFTNYCFQVRESSTGTTLQLGSLTGDPSVTEFAAAFNTAISTTGVIQHVACAPLATWTNTVTNTSVSKFPYVIVHGSKKDACSYSFLDRYENDLQTQWGQSFTGLATALESEKVAGLRCVVMSRFGWIVLSENNQPKMSLHADLAGPLATKCQQIAAQGLQIQHIAIADGGEWIILYGKNSYATSWAPSTQPLMADQAPPKTALTIENASPILNLPLQKVVNNYTPDVSGFGRHGVISSNAPILAADGKFGWCLDFGASPTYAKLSVAEINCPAEFTLASWVKRGTSTWACIMEFGTGTSKPIFGIYTDGYLTVLGGLTWYNGPVVAADWTHVAATYGNGVLRMYINGARVYEKTVTIAGGGSTLDIGRYEGGMQLTGRLSNVLVFEKALSDAGITELYGKYSTGSR